jgi:hypothetical protein
MSTLIYILVILAVVVGGFVVVRWYVSSRNEKNYGLLQIFKAFQDVQLVIAHESNIDLNDLGEFVKRLAEKDRLLGDDKAFLAYIEDYYRHCTELNRKNERIRVTQSREDLEILMRERNRIVLWFREQDKIIRQHFSRYIAV